MFTQPFKEDKGHQLFQTIDETIGIQGGGGASPPAFENFCKFGQIRARFKIFLGKFGQSLGYFWSFVLDFLGNYSIFSGKKGQPPPPYK